MAKYIPKLPEEVAKDFELVDWPGNRVVNFGKYGTIDLEQITSRQAESLVKRKFSKIRRKSAPPAKTNSK